MRDDSARWDAPRKVSAVWKRDAVSIREITLPRLTLISGADVLADHPNAIGWPAIASGDSYTLCLRRDRVLEVGGPDRPEGWDSATGRAISDLNGGEAVFEVTGPNALPFLTRGAELDLTAPSRSALRGLFGMAATLYRYGAEDQFRLHVSLARGQAMWHALVSTAEAM